MIDDCALQRCKVIVCVVTPNGKQVKTMPQIDCNVEQTWISPPILNSLSRGPLYRAVWSAFLGQALPLPVVIIGGHLSHSTDPLSTCHGFTWHPGWPSLIETFPCSSQTPDARYPNHPICLSGLLSIEASFAWKKCIECHPTHDLDLTIWKF